MIKLSGTRVHRDRRYNDCESFELADETDFDFLNTGRCAPQLCFKFDKMNFQTSKHQRDIAKRGPAFSLS